MSKHHLFTRVGYNYIPTTAIDESINWYKENLGLKFINKFQDRGSHIAVFHYPHQHAIATVLIETTDKAPFELLRNGQPFPVMALNCVDIDYTHQQMKEKGIKVDTIKPLGNGEAKYFYFRDNQGNLLEAAWSIWDTKDDIKEDF
ncbi:VOC family protein [Radiobacillus sp. PE A8.2]|uniref:VOC family protein n=1 Tax=Radiobacillus sp. PE A8.2 TaxID=3380349 RepID=UPI00388FF81F